jgi:hypothetical protein
LSNPVSIRFDSSGESGPPCGVPSSVGPLGHLPYQEVVVDPIEELLQVDIHHPAPARGHVLFAHAPPPDAPSGPGESRNCSD